MYTYNLLEISEFASLSAHSVPYRCCRNVVSALRRLDLFVLLFLSREKIGYRFKRQVVKTLHLLLDN